MSCRLEPHSTIVGGKGDRHRVEARAEQLRRQMKETASDYDREKLEERIAESSGGVTVIKAGAPSETELDGIKESFDDVTNSIEAAIAEGIVPGGGLALLRAKGALERAAAALTVTRGPAC